LFNDGLLDKVETRLAVCSLKELKDNFNSFIDNAIELEKLVLQKRIDRLEREIYPWKTRYRSIDCRTSFANTVEKSEKNAVAIDFDNVIHAMSKGFHDGTVYGNPIPDCGLALEIISKKYDIIIYSCKFNPKRPLINNKTGKELVAEWLTENDLMKFIHSIQFGKPNAIAYIDDKALRFSTWEKCLKDLKDLELL